MIITTEDGREFELTDAEYKQFLIRYAENELVEVGQSDINNISITVVMIPD